MNRPDFETISVGLGELAAVLKARRHRGWRHVAARRGQEPALGLTAAISASLVSAAAKELNEDPLASLVSVDDLSAFDDELCLPVNAYADAGAHDHVQGLRGLSHAGAYARPFYLADPFASPYANSYLAAHGNHDTRPSGGDHTQSSHGLNNGQHSASVTGVSVHAAHGQHDVQQDAHSASQHAHHEAAPANASGNSAHATHSNDHLGHDAVSAHSGQTMEQAAGNLHASQNASISESHGAHDMNSDGGDELTALIDSLSQAVLADTSMPNHAMHEPVTTADAAMMIPAAPLDAPASQDHHHGASLAVMDMPPSDDLSAMPMTPVI